MLPLDHPDRIQITFDDRRLVANAGLLLPVTLAQHLGLRELVDHHLDLGNAPGRANPGDKMLTLVASALAGGDCIDDADVLRTGGTAQTLGCVVKAPSTLGTFLRSFRWGHVRQLDRVSRELLARAWSAGAGPGDAPFTIDLDSTICETYGLAKEGARDHGYTGKRGYHPLLAVAAGTGDVLMARLREGRANTARGAAHFLRETVGRVRHGGARGQLTVRADRGFYTHDVVAVCRKTKVRFSITVRLHQSLRNIIEAIPEEDWTPIPYWMDGAADVAETSYTPFDSEPDAATVGVNGGGKVCHVGGSIVGLRLSFLASWPVDLAKSRTGRGLTTATGNAAAATAATKGSSKPPVASSITAAGSSTCRSATSASTPAASYDTLQCWSAGRVATSTRSLATSIPT